MTAIHWFRRDLRLHDNAALFHALKSGNAVQCIFIFDTKILSQLEDKSDKRVNFIHQQLTLLNKELIGYGSGLRVYYGNPAEIWNDIIQEYQPMAVFTNHDYEPYAIQRDFEIQELLKSHGIEFQTFKDQCIFEKEEVTKSDGKPYTVFTPYSKVWKAKLNDSYLSSYPTELGFNMFNKIKAQEILTLIEIGFESSQILFPTTESSVNIIREYGKNRDYPSINGTSMLGLHFRFGTISVREKARKAISLSETWLNELIWREFYMQILWHFPHVVKGAFRKEYDAIAWSNDEINFEAWCEGKTGYPIVDAGMRQLNATGYMHNRVRMIVASFLTKHLLINWQWGEAYFAKKLLDFDLSANNGGWQWAAGCGTDAAPYFRIFSPAAQTLKFDKDWLYIKKWVPEVLTNEYPQPIVNHEFARARCLAAYKSALQKTE